MSLFPVCAYHLLAMGENTRLGRGWPVLRGVEEHGDTRCGGKDFTYFCCLGVLSNDSHEPYIAAQSGQVCCYIAGASQRIGLGAYLYHRDRGLRRDTAHISP